MLPKSQQGSVETFKMKKGCLLSITAIVGLHVVGAVVFLIIKPSADPVGDTSPTQEAISSREGSLAASAPPATTESDVSPTDPPEVVQDSPPSGPARDQNKESTVPRTKTIYDERKWTSADGKKSFVGKLHRFEKGGVTIAKDWDLVTLSYAQMSPSDREFLGQDITIETVDGTRHENGSITRITPESISFMKDSGPVSIAMENLPKKLRERLGYDPATVLEIRQQEREKKLTAIESLNGSWSLVDAMSGGIRGKDRAPSHRNWTISGDLIILNGDRNLWIVHGAESNPQRMSIINRRGRDEISVCSCLYKSEGDELIVCLKAGEVPPIAFTASENDFNFLLKFKKDW